MSRWIDKRHKHALSCAPKMTPAAGIDFPVKKGGKSDEEAIQ
jgi:hypothetical protein